MGDAFDAARRVDSTPDALRVGTQAAYGQAGGHERNGDGGGHAGGRAGQGGARRDHGPACAHARRHACGGAGDGMVVGQVAELADPGGDGGGLGFDGPADGLGAVAQSQAGFVEDAAPGGGRVDGGGHAERDRGGRPSGQDGRGAGGGHGGGAGDDRVGGREIGDTLRGPGDRIRCRVRRVHVRPCPAGDVPVAFHVVVHALRVLLGVHALGELVVLFRPVGLAGGLTPRGGAGLAPILVVRLGAAVLLLGHGRPGGFLDVAVLFHLLIDGVLPVLDGFAVVELAGLGRLFGLVVGGLVGGGVGFRPILLVGLGAVRPLVVGRCGVGRMVGVSALGGPGRAVRAFRRGLAVSLTLGVQFAVRSAVHPLRHAVRAFRHGLAVGRALRRGLVVVPAIGGLGRAVRTLGLTLSAGSIIGVRFAIRRAVRTLGLTLSAGSIIGVRFAIRRAVRRLGLALSAGRVIGVRFAVRRAVRTLRRGLIARLAVFDLRRFALTAGRAGGMLGVILVGRDRPVLALRLAFGGTLTEVRVLLAGTAACRARTDQPERRTAGGVPVFGRADGARHAAARRQRGRTCDGARRDLADALHDLLAGHERAERAPGHRVADFPHVDAEPLKQFQPERRNDQRGDGQRRDAHIVVEHAEQVHERRGDQAVKPRDQADDGHARRHADDLAQRALDRLLALVGREREDEERDREAETGDQERAGRGDQAHEAQDQAENDQVDNAGDGEYERPAEVGDGGCPMLVGDGVARLTLVAVGRPVVLAENQRLPIVVFILVGGDGLVQIEFLGDVLDFLVFAVFRGDDVHDPVAVVGEQRPAFHATVRAGQGDGAVLFQPLERGVAAPGGAGALLAAFAALDVADEAPAGADGDIAVRVDRARVPHDLHTVETPLVGRARRLQAFALRIAFRDQCGGPEDDAVRVDVRHLPFPRVVGRLPPAADQGRVAFGERGLRVGGDGGAILQDTAERGHARVARPVLGADPQAQPGLLPHAVEIVEHRVVAVLLQVGVAQVRRVPPAGGEHPPAVRLAGEHAARPVEPLVERVHGARPDLADGPDGKVGRPVRGHRTGGRVDRPAGRGGGAHGDEQGDAEHGAADAAGHLLGVGVPPRLP